MNWFIHIAHRFVLCFPFLFQRFHFHRFNSVSFSLRTSDGEVKRQKRKPKSLLFRCGFIRICYHLLFLLCFHDCLAFIFNHWIGRTLFGWSTMIIRIFVSNLCSLSLLMVGWIFSLLFHLPNLRFSQSLGIQFNLLLLLTVERE